MAALFPVFLRLEGRRCVLVGAGDVAAQKLEGLLASGAQVHVVAPHGSERVQRLFAEGALRWSRRPFAASDLAGAELVVAATGDPRVNEFVFNEARKQNVLCNAVDEPERCDFYYPAVVRRGDLQIAISTAGHSPALAQRLRRELEAQFDDSYGDWLGFLGRARRRLFQRNMESGLRRRLLHRLATPRAYERFVRSRRERELAR